MSLANTAERQMLDLINQERVAAGLNPLRLNTLLNDSSEDHSSWMIRSDQFSHTGEGGSSATDRMRAADYPFEGSWASGENIAWQSERGADGISDDVIQLHESLMASPGHRANILNPDFTEIGIGIERGDMSGYDGVVVTQNFARTDGDTSGTVETDTVTTPDPEPTPDPVVPAPDPEPTPEPNPEPTPVPDPDPEPTPDADPNFSECDDLNVKFGTEGDDQIVAQGKWAMVFADAGDDEVTGTDWHDYLDGEAGNDVLAGGKGSDVVIGGEGDDTLDGGSGMDYLVGGADSDVMTGGADADYFDFTAGHDRITDFVVGEDVVLLDTSLVANGADAAAIFAENATVVDGNTVVDFGSDNTLTLDGIADASQVDVYAYMC
jgi:Ca2+-binding RTX toxin-like protein